MKFLIFKFGALPTVHTSLKIKTKTKVFVRSLCKVYQAVSEPVYHLSCPCSSLPFSGSLTLDTSPVLGGQGSSYLSPCLLLTPDTRKLLLQTSPQLLPMFPRSLFSWHSSSCGQVFPDHLAQNNLALPYFSLNQHFLSLRCYHDLRYCLLIG